MNLSFEKVFKTRNFSTPAKMKPHYSRRQILADQLVQQYLGGKSQKLPASKVENKIMMQVVKDNFSMKQLPIEQYIAPNLSIQDLIVFEYKDKDKKISYKQVSNMAMHFLIDMAKANDMAGFTTKINYNRRNIVVLHDFFQTPFLLAGLLNHLHKSNYNVIAPLLYVNTENQEQLPLVDRVKAAISAFLRDKYDFVIIAQGFSSAIAQIISQDDKRCKQLILANPQLNLRRVAVDLSVAVHYARETIAESGVSVPLSALPSLGPG